MDMLYNVLLILHFLGLAMGLSVSFSNMVMGGLIEKAVPAEKPVLGRFPFAMGRVGDIGLTLLIVSGLGLLFGKWGGFAAMRPIFHVKLTLVVVLIGLIGYVRTLQGRLKKGDMAAAATIQVVGKVAFVTALGIVVCAVFAFE
jgi:hypothetical protein